MFDRRGVNKPAMLCGRSSERSKASARIAGICWNPLILKVESRKYIFDLGSFSDRGCPAAFLLNTIETIPSPLDGGDACA
jgi:hypothetical protein